MKQEIFGTVYEDLNNTQYSPLFGGLINVDANLAASPWAAAGTFRNLKVINDPGATWTLMKNGVATTITCGGTSQDTTHSVSVTDADVTTGLYFSLRRVGGLKLWYVGKPVSTALEFESTDAVTSAYSANMQALAGTPGPGDERIGALQGGVSSPGGPFNYGNFRSVAPITGTITRLVAQTYFNFGFVNPAKGVTYVVMVNGVAQDGSGGTPDTSVTIMATVGNTNLFGHSDGWGVPFTVGDVLEVRETQVNNLDTFHELGCSVRIEAAQAGAFAICGSNNTYAGSPDWGTVPGNWSGWGENVNGNNSSAHGSATTGPVTTTFLQGLIVQETSDSVDVTISLRVNDATPANAPLITVPANDNGVIIDTNLAHIVPITVDDTWDTQSVHAGGAPIQYHWAYAATTILPPPPVVNFTTTERVIRRLRRAPHISDLGNRVFIHRFLIDMQTGIGNASGDGSNPQVLIRWSRNGGATFSPFVSVSAGELGRYYKRVQAWKIGQGRDWVFEVVVSDPVTGWNLISAAIDAESGLN